MEKSNQATQNTTNEASNEPEQRFIIDNNARIALTDALGNLPYAQVFRLMHFIATLEPMEGEEDKPLIIME